MSLASQISLFATRAATEFKSVRTALGLKAPLASPVLTGTPTAPTPGTTTNNDVLATTAFVQAVAAGRMQYRGAWAASSVYAVNDVITNGGVLYVVKTAFTSPASFTATNLTAIAQIDVSGFATATSVNARLQFRGAWVASTVYAVNDMITNAGVLYVVKTAFTSGTTFSATNLTSIGVTDLSLYAPLASPVFTGDPQAPTPANADNDTSIATTGFVKNQAYAPLASPAFTGDPTVPDPAASDNDFSIANTGWVTRLTGTAADWVTQFNNALTAQTGALAASKTVPGVVQLGTAAEMLAGVNDTHAVTAASIFGAFVAVDPTDLSAKAAVLPPGSIISLARGDYVGAGSIPSGSLDRSLWRVSGGKVSPITPLVASPATWVQNTGGLKLVLNQPNIVLEPMMTKVQVGSDEYLWIGATTGFFLWKGPATFSYGTGFTDSASSSLLVDGLVCHLDFEVAHAAAPTYQTIVNVNSRADTKPIGERLFGGGSSTSGWYLANFALTSDGQVLGLNYGAVNPTKVGGAVTYRRQVPAV